MASCLDELLEEFEAFQVDEILSEVKKEWVLDQGVTQFGEELEERARLKQAAQAARAAYVKQHWTPGHYPQLTTGWFIEGLDFCCDYWRHQFKCPLTPPPAPPPSPDASQKKKKKKKNRPAAAPATARNAAPRQTKKTTTTLRN